MKRAIFFFTSSDSLKQLDFIYESIPNIDSYINYLTPDFCHIYLVNDDIDLATFKEGVWAKVQIDFDTFGYVYHRKPISDVKTFLNAQNEFVSSIEGMHQDKADKSLIYLSIREIVERNESNNNKTLTQKEFNAIWNNFETKIQINDRIQLLDAIHKSQPLDKITIPESISQNDEMIQAVEDFKRKMNELFDVENETHLELLRTLRGELLKMI